MFITCVCECARIQCAHPPEKRCRGVARIMPEIKRTHNHETLTVSALSARLKRAVEDQFGYVRVQGELSSFKIHGSSGHAYFKLKDEQSVLDGVCWKGVMGKLPFKPEDGLEVVCAGKLTTYPARSNYQLVVEFMEPAGIGAMMALLEARRKKLEAEGLFDPSRKRPIPYLPRIIGVITSPTGAVIRDILHRVAERFPLHVIVWPVLVQGEGAAEQIAAAIKGFNQLPAGSFQLSGNQADSRQLTADTYLPPSQTIFSFQLSGNQADSRQLTADTYLPPSQTIPRPDLLIVARGGGSLEDLWAFNEEVVVRAAAESEIPLISAVGHETDTTLIDFASDHRAPTPTAAAEKGVPVRAELQQTISMFAHRLDSAQARRLMDAAERVKGLSRGLPNPLQLIDYYTQRLDDWQERLRLALPVFLQKKSQRVQACAAMLTPRLLHQQIVHDGQKLSQLQDRSQRVIERRVETFAQRLVGLSQLLDALNYQNVLARGFALVRNSQGKLVTSRTDMHSDQQYLVTFKDGDAAIKPS